MEGFSVPFTVVRCKIRKPTWETGNWDSGVASWPTARLSEMMKSPCSHWNHKWCVHFSAYNIFCSVIYLSNFKSVFWIKILWRTLISIDLFVINWFAATTGSSSTESQCMYRYRYNIHYLVWINQFTIIFLYFLMDFRQNVFCFWPFSYSLLICSSIPNKSIGHSKVKAESLKQAKNYTRTLPLSKLLVSFLYFAFTSISGVSVTAATYLHWLCSCMGAMFQDLSCSLCTGNASVWVLCMYNECYLHLYSNV